MNTWDIFGKYYGFPQCCIDAFNAGLHIGDRVKRQFSGTGYIPCNACNQKTEAELLEAISQKRIASDPFPEEQSYEYSVMSILNSEHFSELEKAMIRDQYADNEEDGPMDIFDVIDFYFSVCSEEEAIIMSTLIDEVSNGVKSTAQIENFMNRVLVILKANEQSNKLVEELYSNTN